jgi:hypothetical protein
MKRIAIALALCALASAAPVTASTWGHQSAAATKDVAFFLNYSKVTFTNRYSFVCQAVATGGIATFVGISLCTMSSSNGGFASAPGVLYPGSRAITVGNGGFDFGTFTICATATGHWLDGTAKTKSVCQIGKPL